MGSDVSCRNMRVISNRIMTVGISTPQEAIQISTMELVATRAKKAKESGVYWPRDFLMFQSVI